MPARARGPYRKSAARRDEILTAALTVFRRSGFRSGSLREIAERVGISPPGVLHHFGSKDLLLIAVLQHRDEFSSERFTRHGRDIVRGLLAVVQSNVDNPGIVEIFTVLAAEATSPDHPAHAYFHSRYRQLRGDLTAALDELDQAGYLRAGIDPATAATNLIALMDGLQVQWLIDPAAVDMVGALRTHFQRLLTPTGWAVAGADHPAEESAG